MVFTLNAGEDVEKLDHHTLLVVTQTDVLALKTSLVVLYKTKCIFTI